MLDTLVRFVGLRLPQPFRRYARRAYRYLDRRKRVKGTYNPQQFFNSPYDVAGTVTDTATVCIEGGFDLQATYHYNLVENAILSELIRSEVDPAGAKVLDIGSGAGHWLDFWIDRGAGQVTGIEISDEAVEALRDRFSEDDEVMIKHGDVVETDLGTERYDIITAIGVMFHIVEDERWEQAVKSCCDALSEGGIAFIGGEFGFISRNNQIHGTDDFESVKEREQDTGDELLVNKRTRSRRQWEAAIDKYGGETVRVVETRVPEFIDTPENNVLVFRKTGTSHGV